ncbi:general transcription factor IIF subunit 1-like [Teleopsis dalmanni]|uniref:general transcription factor IIF subunit 1-like n=1 Tax=Teleopsis dalmanni TaxID=139649 RepID=UPI0018CF8073|nr:general transcription factor IIF subunit 1-like [Teleopsis dalmanni]XP_037951486.1 general transcription factor IIF subunit 1-like [Teleopsis dalmanni]
MSSTSANANASQPSATTVPTTVQEFNIRVPKNVRKKYHVMRYNATLNVDFATWRNVKLERENNMKEFRGMEEDVPKFGAGSEYNRDLREEVRRKKFGISAKKYRPEAQPWILKVGGKTGKKFKGIREGGVGENAAFYVFTHAPDGAIEAYPLHEWYNFQPIQRYKSLSAEEAEHEFGRRKKVINYFSLMLRKRLKGDEEEEKDPEEIKVKKVGGKKSELKISEMDEWIDSDDESDSDEEESKKNEDSDDDKKSKKKKGQEKKKKRDTDVEAFEESDDGDEEGREMDYDTSSSEDEPDPESKLDKDMKSVAEEDALRKLLTSDEEDDEEKQTDQSDKDEDEKRKKDKVKEELNKDKKKSKNKGKDEKKDSSSDFSSDSSDTDDDNLKKKVKDTKLVVNNSRSVTPTTFSAEANKRKLNNMPTDLTGSENSNSPVTTPAKRTKPDMAPTLPSTFAGVVTGSKDDYGITEEAVRRYLMRKPMTATELLQKFKNKKTNVPSDRLVETMTQILKRINPVKQTIQGKMYLSIKTK